MRRLSWREHIIGWLCFSFAMAVLLWSTFVLLSFFLL